MIVELETGVSHEFLKHEIQPWDELEALRQKSQAPCDRHLGGGCDCGRAGEESSNVEAEPAAGEELQEKKDAGRPEHKRFPEKKKRP